MAFSTLALLKWSYSNMDAVSFEESHNFFKNKNKKRSRNVTESRKRIASTD